MPFDILTNMGQIQKEVNTRLAADFFELIYK